MKEILGLSAGYLAEHRSSSPRLDAEILVARAIGARRLDLYLAPERPMAEAEMEALRATLRRRGRGEPIAYITGVREFHGLQLKVTPSVLVPRPETEALVDAALDCLRRCGNPRPVVVDVGTGSGAIACAIAVEQEAARVIGTDLSVNALEVAGENALALRLDERVALLACDCLAGLAGGIAADLIVSNPPYVAEGERASLGSGVVEFEPEVALFAGPDGLSVTRRLIEQAAPRLAPGGTLMIEVGAPRQRDGVEELLRANEAYRDARPILDIGRIQRGFAATRV